MFFRLFAAWWIASVARAGENVDARFRRTLKNVYMIAIIEHECMKRINMCLFDFELDWKPDIWEIFDNDPF